MKPVAKVEALRDDAVVEVLREWLAYAEQGRLKGVVLAGTLDDGVGWNWRGFWRMSEAIGTFEYAKHAMLTGNYNESRGIEP